MSECEMNLTLQWVTVLLKCWDNCIHTYTSTSNAPIVDFVEEKSKKKPNQTNKENNNNKTLWGEVIHIVRSTFWHKQELVASVFV